MAAVTTHSDFRAQENVANETFLGLNAESSSSFPH